MVDIVLILILVGLAAIIPKKFGRADDVVINYPKRHKIIINKSGAITTPDLNPDLQETFDILDKEIQDILLKYR